MKKAKRKKGTAIYFPGEPKTLGLLGKFFRYLYYNYEKIIIFNGDLAEDDFKKMPHPIRGFSYSAGDMKMIDVASEFSKEFSEIVMFAPAGSKEKTPLFILYYLSFVWELIKLMKSGKWFESFIIIKEIIIGFLMNPVGYFLKIEKIRKFKLGEAILVKIYGRVNFTIIFSGKDIFQTPNAFYYIHGRFRRENKTCGHFGFIERPRVFWKEFENR